MTVQQRLCLMLCGILTILSVAAAGQSFPTKPVRLIVSFPPGAGPDIVARTVGQKLYHANLDYLIFFDPGSCCLKIKHYQWMF